MLIVMKKGCGSDDLDRVLRLGRDLGLAGQVVEAGDRTCVALAGTTPPDPTPFDMLPGVVRAIPVSPGYRVARREARPEGTVVRVGPVSIGNGGFTLAAGPCAVESEAQIVAAARFVRDQGAQVLRGGAFKPRGSPYSFAGLELEGLRLLALAREETGLPIVTEALDERSLAAIEAHADMIQIGARNMYNGSLLRHAARTGKPILLKRSMSADLEELLLAAEYVLAEGNPSVVLCERGIRTFSSHSRFTLDLGIVPACREATHLPILVDPSHASGRRDRVPALARAALAVGADGVMVEVHPAPEHARSDGLQALLPSQFAALARDLRELAAVVERRPEVAR